MRPLRLLLDGFGTYRHETEADFSDVDFFALVGPTGSGKSTLIDGLCFALYGTVPRWGKDNEIRHALAPSANSCRVVLVFELAGERYGAVRVLARDKRGVHTTAARLERLDPSVAADAPLAEILEASVDQLASGPDEVRARVQDLLGLSYEHFTQSVLLPQGSFADFLRATSADRQRLLVELLAFGVYKDIGQRARERAQRAEDRLSMARRSRDGLAAATQEAEEAATARLDSLTALAQIVDERLAALTDLQQRAGLAVREAEDVRAEVRLLAALRVPAEVPGLAQRLAAADALVVSGRGRRDEADSFAEKTRAALDGLPDKARLDRLLAAHAEMLELSSLVSRRAQALAAAQVAEVELAGGLGAAELSLEHAREEVQAAERAHAAAHLASGLQVGAACPVCLHPVSALPRLAVPASLAAASELASTTAAAHKRAVAAHQAAAQAVAAAQSAADAAAQQLDKVTGTLAGAPPRTDIEQSLADTAAAEAAAASASREAAARRIELAAAEAARHALADDEQRAVAALGQARDKLVGLGAPAVGAAGATSYGAAGGAAGGADLGTAWQKLASWAAAESDARAVRQQDLDTAADDLRRQAAAASGALAGLLSEHAIGPVAETARVPAIVAEHRVRAEALLIRLRDERMQAAQLDAEIGALREEAHVAKMLGQLLRATSFEGWLCSEALDALMTEASATLMELSGGQYQLDRDERNDLVVIDYEDAGTRRPVHTLSGGETFQAALALALALSRQVIGLSAGLRDLNSMFLDEGFGTLDEDTLETVASTLERLAADKDRMVGVITHVAALADRAPVRFVVSRAGGTSTLRKELG
jgi:DNA repair protein SbcC/Rad50